MAGRDGPSPAEELVKLAELRDKGVLTAKEFEKQKQAVLAGKPARRRRRWWLFPLFLIGLIGVIIGLVNAGKHGSNVSSEVIPTCDSSDAQELVKGAIEKNPSANLTTLRLLSLDQTKELSYDQEKPERVCTGRATLNSGEEQIQYRMYRHSKDDSNLFVWVTQP